MTEIAKSIIVDLGRLEDGSNFQLNLTAASHIGIQGATRSGKSVLTYLLLSGLTRYSEVTVTGIDPTGLLFNGFKFAPRPEWRHSLTIDIEAMGEVLQRLAREMDMRNARLLTSDRDKFETFNSDTPLIVVVLEEYPGILGAAASYDELSGRKGGSRIEAVIRLEVRRLIQEGAKVGFRVLLLAQRMSAIVVGGDERSNIGTRISMRVDNADALKMLHDDVDDVLVQQVRLFEPGIGLVERPGGTRMRFRADHLTYKDYLAVCRKAYPQLLKLSEANDEVN